MQTPKIIIAVKNQPSLQVTIKEYKHPKATANEPYFVLHFSSFDCFFSSKVLFPTILVVSTIAVALTEQTHPLVEVQSFTNV